MLTFESFQASRVKVENLAEFVTDARWEGEPPARGYVYLDALYIERVTDHWPEETRKQGKYYLLLNRSEWISDDLLQLERRLYQWACDEGYCE